MNNKLVVESGVCTNPTPLGSPKELSGHNTSGKSFTQPVKCTGQLYHLWQIKVGGG